jgi:hypothetical protein
MNATLNDVKKKLLQEDGTSFVGLEDEREESHKCCHPQYPRISCANVIAPFLFSPNDVKWPDFLLVEQGMCFNFLGKTAE